MSRGGSVAGLESGRDYELVTLVLYCVLHTLFACPALTYSVLSGPCPCETIRYL